MLNNMCDRETRSLVVDVASLFAHLVVRGFRIPAFDVVILPRFMHPMQVYPFSLKQRRDLDSLQRSVHLQSLQLYPQQSLGRLSTCKFVSISDHADMSLAASLAGMLGSRMLEH